MKKQILMAILILLTSIDLFAEEYSIRGIVMDSIEMKPMLSTAVTLHKLKDSTLLKGMKTKKDGVFEFNSLSKGGYYLKLNQIGYATKYVGPIFLGRDGNTIDLGEVMMTDSVLSAKSVVVTAERLETQYEVDKKVFYVGKSNLTQGGNAVDALKTIPMVEVDANGRIKVRGTTKVQVQIDGKGSGGGRGPGGGGGTRMLETIPAEMIEKIEIITNPSAKNDPDGISGILNIVIDKTKIGGMNLMLNANTGWGDKYRGMAGFRYGKGNSNLFINYFGGSSWSTSEGTTDRYLFRPDTTQNTHQESDGRNYMQNHNLRSRYSYNLTNLSSINMELNYGYSNSESTRDIVNNFYNAQNALIGKYTNRTFTKGPSSNLEASAKYDYKWDIMGRHKFSIDATYSNFYTNSDADYNKTVFDAPGLIEQNKIITRSNSDDRFDNFVLQSDYTRPLSENTKLEVGYKGIFRNEDSKFDQDSLIGSSWIYDNRSFNKFTYKEAINSAYASISRSLLNMSVMVGLRAESANTTLDQEAWDKALQANKKGVYDNDYFSLFPSVHVIYNLNEDDKIQASYSRRINRPTVDQLSPVIDYTDPMTLHYGNPGLKPEYTNAYEINILKYFGRVMILPQAFYRRTNDNISSFQEIMPDGTIGSTYRNMNSSTSYGFEFTVSTPILDWWKITSDVSYYRFKIEGNSYNDNVTNDDYAWNFNLNSMMNFTENLSLQLNSRYRSPVVTAQGKTYETFTMDLGCRYQIIKDKLNMFVRAGNFLNTMKPHSVSSGTYFTNETWSRPEVPNIMIGLSLRLQSGTFGSAKRNDTPRQEELIGD